MPTQIFNLKTFFIGVLWIIVAVCGVISLFYTSYIQNFGYTDLKLWIDTGFYGAMGLIALFIIIRFNRKAEQEKFYQKQLEILNLFENNQNTAISLNKILSKTSLSEIEVKGILEHLVEQKILIPNFSEKQELIYTTTNQTDFEKYKNKIH